MDMRAILQALGVSELSELDNLLNTTRVLWTPDAENKPQMAGYNSSADILGYGGAAGGGKTELVLGLALTQHRQSIIFRHASTELPGINDRLEQLLGGRDNYNAKEKRWRFARHDGVEAQLDLGSFHDPGEERGYQGRPHDFIGFDEAANMRESAVRFLLGWLRSTWPGQRKRVVMSFNPPTDPAGRWIIKFFGPWLDEHHPRPAQPGELRWMTTINGVDVEVDDGRPFVVVDDAEGNPSCVYDFNPAQYSPDQVVTPLTRTFIPARVIDNRFLRDTGYLAVLQGMPEPLRSKFLYGDFRAGMQDSTYQTIPTAWVEAAMARWRRPAVLAPMDSIGLDVALGQLGRGRDDTVLARRHGLWFDQPIIYPSKDCRDGPTVAGYVVAAMRDRAPVHIDVFGVGAQPYAHLMASGQHAIGVNMGDPVDETDATGTFGFANMRSMLWWRMREALDPAARRPLALPPDARLKSELCTPLFKHVGRKIQVQSREEIVKALGASPDVATAYVLALMDTRKMTPDGRLDGEASTRKASEYNPIAPRSNAAIGAYDPTRRRL